MSDNLPEATFDLRDTLHEDPATVAQAADLHVRLTVLSAWVNERKKAIEAWTKGRGEARLAEDGAAPTWRPPDFGTVVLTNPQPHPYVADPDRFAPWYITHVIERDPTDLEAPALFGVDRVRRARVSEEQLLVFDDLIGPLPLPVTDPAMLRAVLDAAVLLSLATDVYEEWVVSEQLLDSLLDGSTAAVDGKPRFVVADTQVVDVTTGEPVPGLAVAPAKPHQVQFRPSTKTKEQVARELRDLIGPPALGG